MCMVCCVIILKTRYVVYFSVIKHRGSYIRWSHWEKTFPTFHIPALSVPQTLLSTVALLFLTVVISLVSHLGPLSSKAYTLAFSYILSKVGPA